MVDNEAVFELEDSLSLQESSASEFGLLMLARVLLLQDYKERARGYVSIRLHIGNFHPFRLPSFRLLERFPLSCL